MNHADLGVFAMETLENLQEAEAQDDADDDRYVAAAFIVAYDNPGGGTTVAFRTSSSNAHGNIQMLQRATLIEAATWAKTAAAGSDADED